MRSGFLKKLSKVGAWWRRHRAKVGKVFLLLALLAVCVLPALVDNTIIGYLPVLLFVLSVIVDFVYLQVLYRNISFSEESEAQICQRGEVVDVGVDIVNKSILLGSRVDVTLFVSDLSGETDASVDEQFTLLPRENRELSLSARFDHVGKYSVGLDSINVHDMLGIFNHSFVVGSRREVIVQPRIVELSRFSVARDQVSDNALNRHSVIADGYDYVGMRDYELGDSMKNVHWKASARFGELLTRIRERQINSNVCVVMDPCSVWTTGEDHMSVYDVVVEASLSIAAHANANGIECSILVPGDGGLVQEFPTRGSWDYVDILEALPKLHPLEDVSPADDVIHRVGFGMYGFSKMVICTAHPTERLVSEAVSASLQGKQVEIIFAASRNITREQENTFNRMFSPLSAAHVSAITLFDSIQMGEE